MNEAEFGKGGFADRVDARDYQWKEVGFGAAPFNWDVGVDIEAKVAESVDNPNFRFPIKDQNGSGSCGGQAWSYLAGTKEALATHTFEERSAKYIYSQTYLPGGGSYGRDNANIFVNQGVAKESVLTSYKNGAAPDEAFMQRPGDITEAARADAKLSKSASYASVDGTNIDEVAQAIRDSDGVILGVSGQNNGTWTTLFPTIPSKREWGHWIYGGKAKVINGKKCIGFANSWGTSVGDQGWQWLTEDWFKARIDGGNPVVFNVWTHIFAAPTGPDTFHHTFTQNLEFGMNGEEVKALQKALQIEGLFPAAVPATGYFGSVTKDAVKKFQTKYGIVPVLGFVGPRTRKILNDIYQG